MFHPDLADFEESFNVSFKPYICMIIKSYTGLDDVWGTSFD